MTLPAVEKRLEEHFGNQYADKDWRPALNAVLEAEGDVVKALEAVRGLASSCHLPRLMIKLPAQPKHAATAQLTTAETDLLDTVKELQR
jgi:hypothetical protein